MTKPIVLLGAGASVDAGVPAATAMTEKIVAHINADRGQASVVAQALNYAVGALIAHDTGAGGNPYTGIDVERLFAAVQMLGSRGAIEVTPFVAAWSPVLESMGAAGSLPPFFDSHFNDALLGRFGRRPSDLIKQAILAVAGKSESEPTYRALEKAMTQALRTLVAVDPAAVDYLAPLLRVSSERPLHVATLNYDRTIEELASRAGWSCDTGIGAWAGGHDWHWDPDADIRLLKLHGSIDWVLTSEVGAGGLREARVELENPEAVRAWDPPPPALVFGARGKLRSDGPFLAMLRAFDDFLASTNSLFVVGYSFRDEHINTAIRRWVNAAPDRTITVVDPAFPTERRWHPSEETFSDELLEAMSIRTIDGGTAWAATFRVVNQYAKEALSTLFGAYALTPVPGPSTSACDAEADP